mmetsp:Transcript_45948/g.76286  ORF Transcript_45948/g.76286 Transcript_45948/m.76286 type:complete len:270 (-) Transcript_45948:133-942(-)
MVVVPPALAPSGSSFCNAPVEAFIRGRRQEAHSARVRQSRSCVESRRTPREAEGAQRDVRREHVKEEHRREIQRENLRLLHRLEEIDRRPSLDSSSSRDRSSRPESVRPESGRRRPSSAPATGRPQRGGSRTGSLNAGARAEEQRRIQQENLRLLRRLQGCKPSVNSARLEAEHRENRRAMQMQRKLAHYDRPQSAGTPRSDSPCPSNTSLASDGGSAPNNISIDSAGDVHAAAPSTRCSAAAVAGAPKRPPPLPRPLVGDHKPLSLRA